MSSTASLLTAYESCERRGAFARDWEKQRLTSTQFIALCVRAGLTEVERRDFGEVAGEEAMNLAEDRGIERPSSGDIHGSVIHMAALSDLVTTALRKPEAPAWAYPPATTVEGASWRSSAFLDPSGQRLRRVVFASSWSDDRHYRELRSWYTMGEMAAYSLPMTMAVVVLGQHRDGRRHGPWTKGFLHPQNHKLRFRKKSRSTSEVFNDKWEQVWREDRSDITNQKWLQSMLDDDVLRDVLFTVDVPALAPGERDAIRRMASQKLERIANLKKLPERSLSVCEGCPFLAPCWADVPYLPNERRGFVRLDGA